MSDSQGTYTALDTLRSRQPGGRTVDDMLVREVITGLPSRFVPQPESGAAVGKVPRIASTGPIVMEWADGGASGASELPPSSGSKYHIVPATVGVGTAAMSLNVLRFVPFYFWQDGVVDRIGGEVTTGAASSVLRLGAYRDNGFFRPDLAAAPLLDTTIDGNTLSPQEVTVSVPVTKGWYWFCGAAQGGTPTVRVINGYYSGAERIDTDASPISGANSAWGYSLTGISGALPSSGTLAVSGSAPPRLFIRFTPS